MLTAFCVVLGTLIIQGLTLKPLLRALDLQRRRSRSAASAAPRANARCRPGWRAWSTIRSPAADAVRQEFAAHLARPEDAAVDGGDGRAREHTRRPSRGARRRRGRPCSRCARSDEIGDDAFHEIEEELDWLEMADGNQGK